MTTAILTEEEEAARAMNDDNTRQPPKEGKERDILQLVEDTMRDSLCLHVIVDCLKGKDRSRIERILKSRHTRGHRGKERDILQILEEESPELSPKVVKAIKHLLKRRSPFLGWLKQLAYRKSNWQKLPDMSEI